MKKQDKEKVLMKLEEMLMYIGELEEILPDEEEYYNNLVKRRACEKTIELAIEALISTATIIVSSQRFGIPTSEENIIDILVRHDVMTSMLGEKIKDMKGFRNLLIHKYGGVDDRLAHEFLTHNLPDFTEFETQIKKYYKKIKNPNTK